MDKFDWHSDKITAETQVTSNYKNTQNARRFLKTLCGDDFKFDRDFMRWIKDGLSKIGVEIEIRIIEEKTIKRGKKKMTNRLDLPSNKTMQINMRKIGNWKGWKKIM